MLSKPLSGTHSSGRTPAAGNDLLLPSALHHRQTLDSVLAAARFEIYQGHPGIIGGSCHKHHFCRAKRFVATNICLARQKYDFLDKLCLARLFFATNTKHNFCRDKSILVATKLCLSRQIFIATNIILSRQAYFCQDKRHVLSPQTIFVATKMTLVQLPPTIPRRLSLELWC